MSNTRAEDRKPGKLSEMMAKRQRGEIPNLSMDELNQPWPGEKPPRQKDLSHQPKPKTSPTTDKANSANIKSAQSCKESQATSNKNHLNTPPRNIKMVRSDPRKDTCILAKIQKSSHSARAAGELFGGIHNGRTIKEQELPAFKHMAKDVLVPLLDIVDTNGMPIKTQNGMVPLEQRLLIRMLSTVNIKKRKRLEMRIAVTLRELRDGMFPYGWHRKNQWPRLRHALTNLNQYAFLIGENLWFPMALRSMPEDPQLEDMILIDISYPEGTTTGPTINLPHLDELSIRSATDYRSFIGAHSLLWQPGKTRVPVPKAKNRFGWAKRIEVYPILTRENRRQIAFGLNDKKHRTRSEIDKPFENIQGIKIVDYEAKNLRTGEVGWRIIHANTPC